ncbi:MAG: gliding motility protein GldB [Marinilabiliaceae bacterium]|nr:gliding motility protein GldB [Marinilabiliaceae bacterium]
MQVFKNIIPILFFVVILFSGCKDKGPDVSNVDIEINVIPFYNELFSIKPSELDLKLPGLKNKYGNYLEVYSSKVINVGSVNNEHYAEYLRSFLEYEPNVEVFEKCNEMFADFASVELEIKNAFRYYKNYFPNGYVPDIYLHISGFNQSMIADSGFISISLDKYLGADCDFYQRLAFPVYLRAKMSPQNIVPDLMRATAYIDFPMNDSINDVANNIIYQGKALWFVKQMIPDIVDTLLFNYSKNELEWCKSNEEQMWASMVENKHVFSNEPLIVKKYIGDAPFTYYFGQDSPGRAGTYIGFRIVEAYLKSNPEISLSDLMTNHDAHIIIRQSGYRP